MCRILFRLQSFLSSQHISSPVLSQGAFSSPCSVCPAPNSRRTRLKTNWRRKSNIKQLKSQMFLCERRGNIGVKVQRFFLQNIGELQFLRSDSEPAGDVEAQLDAFTESVSVSLSYTMLYHTSVLIFHHIMTLQSDCDPNPHKNRKNFCEVSIKELLSKAGLSEVSSERTPARTDEADWTRPR